MDSDGLSPYYFPTTVLFIDDDSLFLENISASMADDLALRTYQRPREALAHIADITQDALVSERCFVLPEADDGDVPVTLDLTPITEILYSEQRFVEVAVVVVDYDMPSMNGLEFCRKLAGRPIKKVLLTGKADESTAIGAFNAGLIDHFVSKSEPNLQQVLDATIRRLQSVYFRQVAAAVMPALGRFVNSFLSDAQFVTYFRSQVAEHAWVEFYLDPVARGLLCIDAAGRVTLLLIGHRRQLPKTAERAAGAGAPRELVELLRRGEVMQNPYDESGDWRRATMLAQPIAGSDWLVAAIANPGHLKIQPERLFTYQYYLEILDYMVAAKRR